MRCRRADTRGNNLLKNIRKNAIFNGDELKAALEANADVVLGGDIALSGWSAIGTESEPFTGSLNGNGYTISGLSGKTACSAM